jgi:hypothetical protein
VEESSQLKADCSTPEEIALVNHWMPSCVGFGKQERLVPLPWNELRFCVCLFLYLVWEYNLRCLTNKAYTWNTSACAGILNNHARVNIVLARLFQYVRTLCCVREIKQSVENANAQLPWRCYLIFSHKFINFGFIIFASYWSFLILVSFHFKHTSECKPG